VYIAAIQQARNVVE